MGMEKEKPYSCEVCKKRYKNLNGLKYVCIPGPFSPPCYSAEPVLTHERVQHKNHSFYCNPELSSQIIAAHLQQQLPEYAAAMQSPSPAPPR